MGHCDGLASRTWCVERETEKGVRETPRLGPEPGEDGVATI